MDKKTEAVLIRRIQRNQDRDAANTLLTRYYKEIFSFVYRQLGNRETAMDITQEIFIAVLRSISSYREDVAAFRTWLYRLASNVLVDYFRSAHYKYEKRKIDINSIVLSAGITLEDHVIEKEHLSQILDILSDLPFITQQILRLKLFSGASFREIGEAMSLPESTVKTRYYAAISKIRNKVELL